MEPPSEGGIEERVRRQAPPLMLAGARSNLAPVRSGRRHNHVAPVHIPPTESPVLTATHPSSETLQPGTHKFLACRRLSPTGKRPATRRLDTVIAERQGLFRNRSVPCDEAQASPRRKQ